MLWNFHCEGQQRTRFHHQYNFICSNVTLCHQHGAADQSINPVSTQCCIFVSPHVCLTVEQCNSIASVYLSFGPPWDDGSWCQWGSVSGTWPSPPPFRWLPLPSLGSGSLSMDGLYCLVSTSSAAVGGASASVMGFSFESNSAFMPALLAILAEVIELVKIFITHCRRWACMHDDHHQWWEVQSISQVLHGPRIRGVCVSSSTRKVKIQSENVVNYWIPFTCVVFYHATRKIASETPYYFNGV